MSTSIPEALNTLSAGLILISAFAMVATRQVQGVLRFFVAQSVLLAASSFLARVQPDRRFIFGHSERSRSSARCWRFHGYFGVFCPPNFMRGGKSPRQSTSQPRCCWHSCSR